MKNLQDEPTLVEDLLLLLFRPDGRGSGNIAGEGTLYYVLAGAVLADLALREHVRTASGRTGSTTVEVVGTNPPQDHLLRSTWDYVADGPRHVQTVLAGIGPTLRTPVLDRLVDRGEIGRNTRKSWGLITTTVLEDRRSARRVGLITDVRAALVEGVEPSARTAALAALVHGSGTLPQFDPEIPWTATVIARAEELKAGTWGAGAAAEAVARTVTASIVNDVIVAAAVLPRS